VRHACTTLSLPAGLLLAATLVAAGCSHSSVPNRFLVQVRGKCGYINWGEFRGVSGTHYLTPNPSMVGTTFREASGHPGIFRPRI
jgi:hypothetical protein